MPSPLPHAWTGGLSALERLLSATPPCLDERALAYAATAGRPRRRSAPAPRRYRYPRGRASDGIPYAAALRLLDARD